MSENNELQRLREENERLRLQAENEALKRQFPQQQPQTTFQQPVYQQQKSGGCLKVLFKLFLVCFFGFICLVILGVIISISNPNSNSSSKSPSPQSNSNHLATPTTTITAQKPPEEKKVPLILESFNWERNQYYLYGRGTVKNNTDAPITSLMAVVSYLDENGQFVKTAEAVISYNPLLPGQTSPFETIETDNPAIKKARVEFKKMFGGTLDYENKAAK